MLNNQPSDPKHQFYITGSDITDFSNFAKEFLALSDIDVEHLDLVDIQLPSTYTLR